MVSLSLTSGSITVAAGTAMGKGLRFVLQRLGFAYRLQVGWINSRVPILATARLSIVFFLDPTTFIPTR